MKKILFLLEESLMEWRPRIHPSGSDSDVSPPWNPWNPNIFQQDEISNGAADFLEDTLLFWPILKEENWVILGWLASCIAWSNGIAHSSTV